MGTWVVTADSCRARIFDWTAPGEPLTEREAIVHEASRLHDSDIASDRQGRSNGKGGGGNHAVGGGDGPHDHEADVFAKTLAGHLDGARVKGHVQRLVLMAPPSFLGRLRKELNDPTRALVSNEIAKDLVTLKPRDLAGHLPTGLIWPLG